MKIYLITDTHFGHEKMQVYCNRPKGFEDSILKKLLQVKPDLLIHLGDFCIGNDEKWHKEYFSRLNCKNWLIRGNHDRKSNSWYLSHGWDWIGHYFQDRFFGKNILFSHTPVRYTEMKSGLWGSDSFDLNIHGHFHNNLHRLQESKFVVEGEKERNEVDLANLTPRHKLLSIEETNYQPISLERFLNIEGIIKC